jgi:hypothetical protein
MLHPHTDSATAFMLAPPADPDDDAKMFDLAPVSLWIEDYSAVKA